MDLPAAVPPPAGVTVAAADAAVAELQAPLGPLLWGLKDGRMELPASTTPGATTLSWTTTTPSPLLLEPREFAGLWEANGVNYPAPPEIDIAEGRTTLESGASGTGGLWVPTLPVPVTGGGSRLRLEVGNDFAGRVCVVDASRSDEVRGLEVQRGPLALAPIDDPIYAGPAGPAPTRPAAPDRSPRPAAALPRPPGWNETELGEIQGEIDIEFTVTADGEVAMGITLNGVGPGGEYVDSGFRVVLPKLRASGKGKSNGKAKGSNWQDEPAVGGGHGAVL